jgi:hypothetical protein
MVFTDHVGLKFLLRGSGNPRYTQHVHCGTGGAIMSLARPFHLMMVFAAFLFVGAVVIGAI